MAVDIIGGGGGSTDDSTDSTTDSGSSSYTGLLDDPSDSTEDYNEYYHGDDSAETVDSATDSLYDEQDHDTVDVTDAEVTDSGDVVEPGDEGYEEAASDEEDVTEDPDEEQEQASAQELAAQIVDAMSPTSETGVGDLEREAQLALGVVALAAVALVMED